MLILRLAEYSFSALFLWVIIFQIIIPLWMEVPIFPVFRKTRKVLLESLHEVNARREESDIRAEIEAKLPAITPPPTPENQTKDKPKSKSKRK